MSPRRSARPAPPRAAEGASRPRPAPAAPLTTTRQALLVGGSDQRFRELVRNLMTLSSQLQELRAGLAARLGVSEPEYRVFLAVAQLQGEAGVGVGAVARHLGVTGAFVTMVAQRLVRAGHLGKAGSTIDRRGVLLTLTAAGQATMTAFAGDAQAINDELFGGIGGPEFRQLSELLERIVAGGERALVVSRLKEMERRRLAAEPRDHTAHDEKGTG